jgi:ACS family hexuronate transporter-like MFS transporter
MKKVEINGLRWFIAVLLFLATVICYIDRLTISILAPVIKVDLNLTNVQYAAITTWFLFPYSIFQSVFGGIYDKYGTRKVFSFAMVIWSVSAMLHSVVRGFRGLAIFRFALGVGEAGNWPGAIKTIAEWFPARQRAFGLSIVNTGAALGSVVAPPMIAWLQIKYGWKTTFLVTGALGFLWLVLWLLIYHHPAKHPWLGQKEKDFISSDKIDIQDINEDIPARTWKELLRLKQVWGIILARFFGDPIWWLYLIWLPSYLYDVRGFSIKDIGTFAWLPFLASGVGSLSGGWLSGYLIGKGKSVNFSRKIAIILPTFLMILGVGSIYASTAFQALMLISLVLFGFQFWVNNIQTLASDYFTINEVGRVTGMSQTGAGLGAIMFTMLIGWIVDHFSYSPVLVIGAILGPVATMSILLLGGKIHRLQTSKINV